MVMLAFVAIKFTQVGGVGGCKMSEGWVVCFKIQIYYRSKITRRPCVWQYRKCEIGKIAYERSGGVGGGWDGRLYNIKIAVKFYALYIIRYKAKEGVINFEYGER